MNLLKHILLALLICLTTACSGSKMEPIGEDPFLNNENNNELDGELSLDGSDSGEGLTLDGNQGSGELTLTPEIPRQSPRPAAPLPSARPRHNPAPPPVLTPQPAPEVGCPTCPRVPTVVQVPCQPTCPQVPVIQDTPCQRCPQLSETCNTVDVVTSSPTHSGQVRTKIVFVVDKGSHNYTPNNYAREGNDNLASTRMHHIRQFFEDHRNRGFSWSMITFKGRGRGWQGFAKASVSLDDRGRQPVFTEDYDVISQAIDNLSAYSDGAYEENKDHGKIQYGDALQLTEKLIKEDIERQADDAYYLVFFLAGASPSDRQLQNRYPFDEYVYKEVGDIVKVKPERVFLSTAYYGWNHLAEHFYGDGLENPNVLNVTDILQSMANIGKGQFFHLTNVGRHYDGAQEVNCQNGNSPCDAEIYHSYDPGAPALLSLPNDYFHQEQPQSYVPQPCAGIRPPVVDSNFPCGHSEEEHGRVYCPYGR